MMMICSVHLGDVSDQILGLLAIRKLEYKLYALTQLVVLLYLCRNIYTDSFYILLQFLPTVIP